MAKSIMVQGTMSNAGKSLIAAGLCRIFRQDGYRVAPFKSQNMALNSYITREGLEMGRAQVMQAEAAGVEPSVLMNPILLKPVTDMGSQVIVNGEVIGNMRAVEYFRYKKKLVPDIMKAYNTLSDQYDIIVLEGAGSPAEINLNHEDIVNMGMARLAGAPVLLVGDIDRGGVFASLYGTIKLLKPEERAMVKGIIINKFRGDVEILRPGLGMIEELTGVPVLGVMPYTQIVTDEEDSLAESLNANRVKGLVDIAVIRLPHISNFTDFSPLDQAEGLGVRYVKNVRELKNPDMVILPGTKNTIGDLLWLRREGLEAAICRFAEKKVPILGICGGFQMLGQSISDPYGMEHEGTVRGMGLLPVSTVFEMEKTRTRVSGRVSRLGGVLSPLSGAALDGYEIHMGRTLGDAPNLTWLDPGSGSTPVSDDSDGLTSDGGWAGNVYGTYLHGFFDSGEAVKGLSNALFTAKGIDPAVFEPMDSRAFKESQYDLLAKTLRASLDMEKIYEMMERGIPNGT